MPSFDELDDPSNPVQAIRNLTRGQRWTLVVSCLSVALAIEPMAGLYSSLPAIAAHATQSQLTWAVDGYAPALACLVLPTGDSSAESRTS